MLWGLYKDYKTKYYVGLKKGKLVSSTRKKDLERVLSEITVGRKPSKVVVAYCPHCNSIIQESGSSDYYIRAMEKAKSCEEYYRLVEIWRLSRTLGEALVEDLPLDPIILSMDGGKLKLVSLPVIQYFSDRVKTVEARAKLLKYSFLEVSLWTTQ